MHFLLFQFYQWMLSKKTQLNAITSQLDTKERELVSMSQQEFEGMQPLIERTVSELKERSIPDDNNTTHSTIFNQTNLNSPSDIQLESEQLKSILADLNTRVKLRDRQISIQHDLKSILDSVESITNKMGNIIFCDNKLALGGMKRSFSESQDLLVSDKEQLTEVEERWSRTRQDSLVDESVVSVIQSSFEEIHSRYGIRSFETPRRSLTLSICVPICPSIT